jgi:hypothetical protein
MISIVRRRVVYGLAALLGLALLGGPVSAADPPNHEHPYLSGHYGVHILIDGNEPYSGVACHYSAGSLDGMQIRRPIAFPDGPAQYVGWRYQIEGTDSADLGHATWHAIVASSPQKVWAPAKQPAPFTSRSRQLNGLTYANYRVVVKMLWFKPASQVDGRAFLAVESYRDANGPSRWKRACPSAGPIVASGTALAAPAGMPANPDDRFVSGRFGLNLLIDETDLWSFSGATCKYRGDGLGGTIDVIKVRRPIAFPAGSGQWMGWRYVIEGTNHQRDPLHATWTHVASGALQKVWASAGQPARFLPRIYHQPGFPSFKLYRVVVKVYWYQAGHVDGTSWMAVESYDNQAPSNQDPGFEFGCYSQLP